MPPAYVTRAIAKGDKILFNYGYNAARQGLGGV